MEAGPTTLLEAVQYFTSEENCINYLATKRWPDGIAVCPICGKRGAGFLAKQKRWQCSNRHPKRQFSIKVGTVMEDSPIGLDKWLPVMWLIANCRNGISSWEIHRDLQVTQKTAWFMLQRIRLAMQDDLSGGKLGGPMGPEVEVDETFIGGKARNMHKDRKMRALENKRGGTVGKTVVLGVLERKGHVRTRVASNATQPEIRNHVLNNVEFGSRINSDEAGERWGMPQHYIHEMVNHAAVEYVRGNVHTNGIENFWSLLKRGIGGTYVAVEPFHLFRYVDEQAFRYNNRKHKDGEVVTDAERFGRLCSQIIGRRLTYKELTGKEGETEAF